MEQEIQLLQQINANLSALLSAINVQPVVTVLGSTKLNSTTKSFYLNPNYYYDLVFYLDGTVTADVPVYVTIITESEQGQSAFNLNNTVSGYRLEGVKANSINVDTANLSTGTIYVSFIGYTGNKTPRLKLK